MSHNKIIITVAFLFAVLFSLYSEESQKQKINFARSQKVGDVLKCDIHAQNKASSVKVYKGQDKKQTEQYVNSLKLKGTLTVLGVVESGHSGLIEFNVDSLQGILNNQPYNPDLIGKTIIADLKVKPFCKFKIKGSDVPLSKKDIILLSLVFRPVPKETMQDYIGTDKPVGVGDSWDAPKGPLLGLIKKYAALGIKLPPEKIAGKVNIKSRTKYQGIDCWEIEEQLSINDVPDFGFGFIVKIMLPVDDKSSSVRLFRKGVEKIEKRPKSNHPMMVGIKKIIVTLSDEMNAEMIPIKNLEPKNK